MADSDGSWRDRLRVSEIEEHELLCDDVRGAAYRGGVCARAIFDMKAVREQEAWAAVGMMGLTLGLLLLGSYHFSSASLVFTQEISDPLRAVDRQMREVASLSDAPSPQGAPSGIVEIAHVQETCWRMSVGLNAFTKFVPAVVARRMVQTHQTPDTKLRRRPVTSFFSDIRSFTSLCEGLPPEKTLRLLSKCGGRPGLEAATARPVVP